MFSALDHFKLNSNVRHVKIGEAEVFGVIDPFNNAYVGNRKELSSRVRSWLGRIKSPLTKLNFAHFCGDREIRRSAAIDLYQEKRSEYRSENLAASWFILKHLILSQSQENIPEAKYVSVNFSAKINRSSITLEIPLSVVSKDVSVHWQRQIEELSDLTKAATGRLIKLEFTIGPEAIQPQASVAAQAREMIFKAARFRRQEKRLAVLLSYVIEYPEIGTLALSMYSDKALYIQRCISNLLKVLGSAEKKKDVEFKIAQMIPSFISSAWPHQKGRALFEFAHQLSSHPNIATSIRNYTNRSRSIHINPFKEQILEALERRSMKSKNDGN